MNTLYRLNRITPILFMALIYSALALCKPVHAQEPATIKHYDKGFSPLFRAYLSQVLLLVLDKSVAEYGPYNLQHYSKELSTNRSKLETERGQLLNVLFASHWRGNYTQEANVIAIEFPIFNGMLGLRSLIINKDRDSVFTNISSAKEFQSYTAGQGANWEDVKILKQNGIPVMEAQLFDSLFPMLAKNRYDYLPLSTLEIDTTLESKGLKYKNLTINKDISIFYPMQFSLFVNAQEPKLAERLKKGLNIAIEDGSIETLFEKNFGFIVSKNQEKTKNLLIYNSPLLSPENSQKCINKFLEKYQNHFNIIH